MQTCITCLTDKHICRARLTMEERNIDLQEGIRRNRDRVRRRLDFGGGDDNDVEKNNIASHLSIEEELQREREQKKRKWNFDFEKEEPLPGRWEWEKVSEDEREVSAQSSNEIQNPQEENGEKAQNGIEETNEARQAN